MKNLTIIQSDNHASLITVFYGYISLLTIFAAGLMILGNYLVAPVSLTLSNLGCYLVERPWHGGQLLGIAFVLIVMIDLVAVLLSRINVAQHWISLVWIVLVNTIIGSLFSVSASAIIACYGVPAISFGFCSIYAAITRQNLAKWHNLVLFSLINIGLYIGFMMNFVAGHFKDIPWKTASKLSFDMIVRYKDKVLPIIFQSLELIGGYIIIPTVVMILVIMLTAQEVKRLEKRLEQQEGRSSINLLNSRVFFLFFKLYYFIRYSLVKLIFALFGLSADAEV